jgi:hypothetical protein
MRRTWTHAARYPVPMPSAADSSAANRRENRTVVLVALAVAALAAYRASVGQSFYDDTFYAVVPWRFAHGARFLIDELSLQAVGEMISVPLVWVWERFAGLTGIVLAIRLLWVALAAAGTLLATRMLRGSVRVGVAVFAVTLPLLAPPYHVFAPTYNTVSQLLLTLAVVLGFAAMRDRSPLLAAWVGVAIALGAAAYPPLALAALVLLATFVVMARDARLAGSAVTACVAVGAVVGAALFARTSLADLRLAIAFGSANVASFSAPLDKFTWTFGNTGAALAGPLLLPMWALAVGASVVRVPARWRSIALALIPLAAAAPAAELLLRGDHLAFGTSVQSWLITTCAALVVPSALAARRLGRGDLLRFLALAAPFSAVGYLTVAYVTNSSWNRGMPAIAIAPLAVGILLCWGTSLAEEGSDRAFWAGAVVTLLVAFALLFSTVFGDNSFWQPQVRVKSGAYAGLLTSPAHRDALDALARRAPRWVSPTSRVTFLGQKEAYLASGGTPLTPAAWLFLGPADSTATAYFNRVEHTPDVVFVADADVGLKGGYRKAATTDPMLRWVMTHYHLADDLGGFSVFVRP